MFYDVKGYLISCNTDVRTRNLNFRKTKTTTRRWRKKINVKIIQLEFQEKNTKLLKGDSLLLLNSPFTPSLPTFPQDTSISFQAGCEKAISIVVLIFISETISSGVITREPECES